MDLRPVLVVDFGAQYAQLIARRVREARVYSELVSHRLSASEIAARHPAALVLSGGPASGYAEGAPQIDPAVFELGVPTLGICDGMKLMAGDLGGAVDRVEQAVEAERNLEVGNWKAVAGGAAPVDRAAAATAGRPVCARL